MNDKFASKKKPSRQFLLDIIGTIYPGFFQEVIEAQTNARFEKQASEEVGDHILATDEWVDALASHPFESSKFDASIFNLLFILQKRKESSCRSSKQRPNL